MIIGVDPGPTQSGLVALDGRRVLTSRVLPNDAPSGSLLHVLGELAMSAHRPRLVIEMIASYGMPVGAETFETCVWIGRIIQHWAGFVGAADRLTRAEVKMHLCGSMRAKDANVRQALIDRFTTPGRSAIGRRGDEGPLYGVKSHAWAALAVAVTFADRQNLNNTPRT